MILDGLYDSIEADPAFKELRSKARFVPGQGPLQPQVMLVGEAPGSLENAKQVPFIGMAGQQLNKILIKVGLNPRSLFITNVVKYWPQETVGKTRTPTDEELELCRDYLLQEIDIVRPHFIGLMGLSAIRTIFPGTANVYSVNGQVLDKKYVPLYHPAACLYAKEKEPQVIQGFRELAKLAKRIPLA